MIINRTNYPCLHDDGSIEYGTLPKVLRYENFTDADYWYIEILCTYKKSVSDQIVRDIGTCVPIEILEKIKNGNLNLLILSIEPFVSTVEDIYNYIDKHNIPESKVSLVSELIDINEEVDRVSKQFGLHKIETYWINHDEHGISFQLRQNFSRFANCKPLSKLDFTKSFLNFNRRWRPHRPLFVSLLKCKNLLDKGYVSLGDTGETDYNWPTIFETLIDIVDEDTKQLLTDHESDIVSLPKMYVDTNDLSANPNRLDDMEETMSFYDQTYFSVVSETCFFDDVGRFLTEKTFKPVAHRHPFILLAPARTLEFLRSQKYKTFHPYIDESYDLITDNMTRMKMVLAETERLSNLSKDELAEFIHNVTPIVEYNFLVLYERSPKTFITKRG